MKTKIMLTFLMILTLLTGNLSCQQDSDPQPEPFQRYQKDEGIRSQELNREIKYSIILPKDYDKNTDKRYPVVYMLHGYGDDNNSWNGNWLHAMDKITYLESCGLSDMIYVFPQGFNTYYCNYYTGAFNYMDMFVYELMPYIDKTYRTIPDRQHRCITGYSMGGFGAMVLAEKHPEMFICSAPLSMSFRTDAQYMAEPQSGWDNQWGTIFGGKGMTGQARLTDYYKLHCPYYQFNEENRAELTKVKWFFTCGDDEENLLFANDSLHVILRSRDYDHEFRVADGAHTSKYWMAALDEVLPMFEYYINGGTKWPGIKMDVPTTSTVTCESDGAFLSEKYRTEKDGTLFYLFHDGLSAKELNDFIYLIQNEKTGAFAILPCNIGNKSIDEVIADYEKKYSGTRKLALTTGNSAGYALTCGREFERIYWLDSNSGLNTGDIPQTTKCYLACTDKSSHYDDMFILYKKCKLSEYSFEYRIIKGTDDKSSDRLRLIQTLNQYLPLY